MSNVANPTFDAEATAVSTAHQILLELAKERRERLAQPAEHDNPKESEQPHEQ